LSYVFRIGSIESHPTEIGEYPILMGLDDAPEGRMISAGRFANVRVDFQSTAPDLPVILAGREKVTE
jgi:hypothetical protein